MDSHGSIWLSQAGNESVITISPDFSVKQYPIPVANEGIVSSVRESTKGIYVTSNSKDSYLFFKAHNENAFKNISLPVNFKVSGDFSIVDMVEIDSAIWLASSEGLLTINHNRVERINLGEKYTDLSVKSVKKLSNGQLLFVNSMGMFRYEIKSGNFWLYDEGNGIASNAITTRGLFVGENNRVWIGTSRGLSYSRESIDAGEKTQTPYFIDVKVNGVNRKFTEGLTVPYGSYINIEVSAITFPENNVTIQYRIANRDTAWRLPEQSVIGLSELREGRYQIEIRARKHGGYSWSNTRTLSVLVNNPFWKEEWFIAFVAIAVGLVAYLSFSIAAYFNKKRRKELEDLVSLRTHELQQTNDELTIRNTELDRFVYSASHDLSAPLKSMLGLVNVARKEKPDEQMLVYLDMIEKSAKRLELFIKDVINHSRNARAEIEKTEIDFEPFVKALLADHQYATNSGNIEFRISSQLRSKLVTDEMRLKIILNNLISNAIKFHFTADGRQPFIAIRALETETSYMIEVEDNGRGIEEEMQGKIFQMFFRATDSVQGSGLGLYILKETTAKLGGEVSVRSELDRGTTFTIKLPKQK